MHNHDYTALQHPRYTPWIIASGAGHLRGIPQPMEFPDEIVLLGDEVADSDEPLAPLGVVTDIHGESFTDGGNHFTDGIRVLPAAVTLSSGDRYPIADLVLLRRAER